MKKAIALQLLKIALKFTHTYIVSNYRCASILLFLILISLIIYESFLHILNIKNIAETFLLL